MNYYVLRPDLTPYEGIIVTKETELEFENEFAKQTLKDLELVTIHNEKNEKYDVESKMTLHLVEGDVLLFEKERRGYFLPAEPIGTIKTAIKDLQGLANALDDVEYELIEKNK